MTNSNAGEEIVRTPVVGPGAWRGADLARRTDWLLPITAEQQRELFALVEDARQRGLGLGEIERDTFALAECSSLVADLESRMENGPGLAVVRGLDIEGLSAEDAGMLFFLIGRAMGTPIRQNAQGHLLGHIRDTGRNIHEDPSVRGYQTRVALPFHTDTSTDLLGLFCFRTAKSGGESFLAPLLTIYNEVLRRAPELIDTLYQPFHYDCRDEEHPDGKPYYSRTAASVCDGRLSLRHNSGYARSAQRHESCPPLTEAQSKVMQLIDELSFDPEIHFSLRLDRGDMLFVNNYQVMHARSEFEDHPEEDRRRHLLRLWLHLYRGRRLAPSFDNRGGIVTTDGDQSHGLRG